MPTQKTIDRDATDSGLRSFMQLAIANRGFILAVTAVCLVLATVVAFNSKPKYRATLQFSIVADDRGGLGALGSVVSQLGPLASLAGVSVGSGSQKSEAAAILQSRSLTQAFIDENNLMPILYAKMWDATAHRWLETDIKRLPTPWKASDKFMRLRQVVQDAKTGIYTLSVTWTDPKVAAQWANQLVALTDRRMREKAIAQSEKNIAYLTLQSSKTQLVGLQNALGNLMEGETKRAMLARGSDEFAIRVIDPAIAPERPSSPSKLTFMLGGVLSGIFLAFTLIFLRETWRT